MRQPDQPMPSIGYFARRLILYDRLRYAAVALAWILFHSWPLLPGLLAKLFFDTLEGRAPAGLTLVGVVALALAAGLAKMAIIVGTALAGRPWTIRVSGLVQRNLLARILERPGARALPGSVGEAISTFRDDVELMRLLGDWWFDACAGLILAGGGLAILLSVDARVTLLVFLPLSAVILLAHAARTRLEGVREQSREATAQVTGMIGEIFGAVQAIQVAGAQEQVVARLRRLGQARQQSMLRDRLLALSLDAIFANTASLGAGLTLLVAASSMRAGSFSIGDFALFATYLLQVAEYTGFLGYLIATYRQFGVALRRCVALLQGAPPQRLVEHHALHLDGPLPAVPALARSSDDRLERLEVLGLTLRHAERGQGVQDISFTLERGSITVLTGRVGAGKTTLLRALLGLLEPQSGQVRWNGRLVQQPASVLLPPRVAYTAQVPALLSGTLRENLLLGLPAHEASLALALHGAALEQDLAGFPAGLDTRIGVRGMRLSGGQVLRTAAARMLLRDAELLVIDDLSSALDVETERLLWSRLLAAGKTCLVVSHRPAVLERADQILLLEQGRIVARGRLGQLLASSPAFRQLYGASAQAGTRATKDDSA